MMASIRLFGRGKSAAGAGGGTAVSAEQIAQALAGLQTASMSTTWRCRHGSGTALGEGAVDFETGRSRATVVRGKHAFEYVRVGSSVYRAVVPDEEVRAQLGGGKDATPAAAGAKGSAAVARLADDDEEDDEDLDDDAAIEAEAEEEDEDGFDGELEGELDDQLDSELDGQAGEDEDGADLAEAEDEDGDRAQAGARVEDVEGLGADGDVPQEQEQEQEQEPEKDADEPLRAWQTFSEHDACGVHAYAEPAVLAAGVRAAGSVSAAGRREFDGRMLTGYAVTLKPKPADPDRLLARLARQLRDHGANTLVVTAFVDEADGAAGSVPDFSGTGAGGADSDGGARIVRLRLELAHWTPADDPTADHAVTVDLFEFGDPVQVEVPAGAMTRRSSRSCADLALF